MNKAELQKGERRSGGGGAVASRSFDLLNLDLDDLDDLDLDDQDLDDRLP